MSYSDDESIPSGNECDAEDSPIPVDASEEEVADESDSGEEEVDAADGSDSGEEEVEAADDSDSGEEEVDAADDSDSGEEEVDAADATGEEEVDAGEEEEDEDGGLNPDQLVTWSFRREQVIGQSCRVQVAMKEGTFAIVRRRLRLNGSEAFAAMSRSAFGMYLNYPSYLLHSESSINYLVSRQVEGTPDPGPNSIWFKVGEDIIRFSRVEFALVTGLRFGSSQFNPYGDHEIPRTSVYTRLFNNNKMTSAQLWYQLSDDSFVIANADDSIKVCKVLIAAHVVMGLDPDNWKIPEWIWVLVEDEHEWERFPWGSISYQILVRAISNVTKEPGYEGYHLHCNTLAFLGWIYNAFPEIGREIGGVVFPYDSDWPRGLRYSYMYVTEFDEFDIDEVHGVLTPTDQESETDYYKSLEPVGDFFGFVYDPDFEETGRVAPGQRKRKIDEVSDGDVKN